MHPDTPGAVIPQAPDSPPGAAFDPHSINSLFDNSSVDDTGAAQAAARAAADAMNEEPDLMGTSRPNWPEGVNPTDDSEGGTSPGTNDNRSPFIPRDRFDEVNARMQAAERELAQFRAGQQPSPAAAPGQQAGAAESAPLETVPDFLRGFGGTEPQAPSAPAAPSAPQPPQAQTPQQPATPQTAEEFYNSNVPEGGVAYAYLEPWEQAQVRTEFRAYRTETLVQQMAQERQAEREAEQHRQQQFQMAQAEQQLEGLVRNIASQEGNEMFRGQFMGAMLAEAIVVGAANQLPPAEVVRRIKAEFDVSERNAAAQAVLNPAQPANPLPGQPQPRPVTAGGESPSPAEDRSWVQNATPSEFSRKMRSVFQRTIPPR